MYVQPSQARVFYSWVREICQFSACADFYCYSCYLRNLYEEPVANNIHYRSPGKQRVFSFEFSLFLSTLSFHRNRKYFCLLGSIERG